MSAGSEQIYNVLQNVADGNEGNSLGLADYENDGNGYASGTLPNGDRLFAMAVDGGETGTSFVHAQITKHDGSYGIIRIGAADDQEGHRVWWTSGTDLPDYEGGRYSRYSTDDTKRYAAEDVERWAGTLGLNQGETA